MFYTSNAGGAADPGKRPRPFAAPDRVAITTSK